MGAIAVRGSRREVQLKASRSGKHRVRAVAQIVLVDKRRPARPGVLRLVPRLPCVAALILVVREIRVVHLVYLRQPLHVLNRRGSNVARVVGQRSGKRAYLLIVLAKRAEFDLHPEHVAALNAVLRAYHVRRDRLDDARGRCLDALRPAAVYLCHLLAGVLHRYRLAAGARKVVSLVASLERRERNVEVVGHADRILAFGEHACGLEQRTVAAVQRVIVVRVHLDVAVHVAHSPLEQQLRGGELSRLGILQTSAGHQIAQRRGVGDGGRAVHVHVAGYGKHHQRSGELHPLTGVRVGEDVLNRIHAGQDVQVAQVYRHRLGVDGLPAVVYGARLTKLALSAHLVVVRRLVVCAVVLRREERVEQRVPLACRRQRICLRRVQRYAALQLARIYASVAGGYVEPRHPRVVVLIDDYRARIEVEVAAAAPRAHVEPSVVEQLAAVVQVVLLQRVLRVVYAAADVQRRVARVAHRAVGLEIVEPVRLVLGSRLSVAVPFRVLLARDDARRGVARPERHRRRLHALYVEGVGLGRDTVRRGYGYHYLVARALVIRLLYRYVQALPVRARGRGLRVFRLPASHVYRRLADAVLLIVAAVVYQRVGRRNAVRRDRVFAVYRYAYRACHLRRQHDVLIFAVLLDRRAGRHRTVGHKLAVLPLERDERLESGQVERHRLHVLAHAQIVFLRRGGRVERLLGKSLRRGLGHILAVRVERYRSLGALGVRSDKPEFGRRRVRACLPPSDEGEGIILLIRCPVCRISRFRRPVQIDQPAEHIGRGILVDIQPAVLAQLRFMIANKFLYRYVVIGHSPVPCPFVKLMLLRAVEQRGVLFERTAAAVDIPALKLHVGHATQLFFCPQLYLAVVGAYYYRVAVLVLVLDLGHGLVIAALAVAALRREPVPGRVIGRVLFAHRRTTVGYQRASVIPRGKSGAIPLLRGEYLLEPLGELCLRLALGPLRYLTALGVQLGQLLLGYRFKRRRHRREHALHDDKQA